MGIFDWLFGNNSNVELQDERIWLTTEAKFAGIGKAVDERLAVAQPPVAVILVAQFKDCLTKLEAIDPKGWPVTATLAVDLHAVTGKTAPLSADQSIDVVVAERHPLRKHDEAVLEFARSLPCRCRVAFHLSLEDPLLKAFAGERVENMLKQLGMQDDEAIQSRMVARRIQEAQRQIENRVVSELLAESAEEWMNLNCRNT